jgi:hypothetical protein
MKKSKDMKKKRPIFPSRRGLPHNPPDRPTEPTTPTESSSKEKKSHRKERQKKKRARDNFSVPDPASFFFGRKKKKTKAGLRTRAPNLKLVDTPKFKLHSSAINVVVVVRGPMVLRTGRDVFKTSCRSATAAVGTHS